MRARLAVIAATTLVGLSLAAPARAAVLITVDKSSQRMTVEVDGELRWTWPVSTGQLGYDTPSGRYTAFRMEADHFSKEWDDAPMPHSIFFTQKGHAIHGYLNTSRIGRPASHGCVRLADENAAKLYALVEEQGLPSTKVVLTGDVRVALGRRAAPREIDDYAAAEPMEARGYSDGYAPRRERRAYGYQPYYRSYSVQPPLPPGYPPNYYDTYRAYRGFPY